MACLAQDKVRPANTGYWDAVSALSNLLMFTSMDYQGLT